MRFGPDGSHQVFEWLMIGGPLLAAAQIAFFTIFDRERLHSEKYLERKMLISKIAPQLGDAGTVIEMEGGGTPTTNPKAIEGKDV